MKKTPQKTKRGRQISKHNKDKDHRPNNILNIEETFRNELSK